MSLPLTLFITLVVVIIVLSFLYVHLCELVHGFFAPAPRSTQVDTLLKTGAELSSEIKCPPTPNPSVVSSRSQGQAVVTAESNATEQVNSEQMVEGRIVKGSPVNEHLSSPAPPKRVSSTLDDRTQKQKIQAAKDASESSEMRVSRCPSFEEEVNGKETKLVNTDSDATKKKEQKQIPAEAPLAPSPTSKPLPAGSPKGLSASPPGKMAAEKTPSAMKLPVPASPDVGATGKGNVAVGQTGTSATNPDESCVLKTAQIEATDTLRLDYEQEKQTGDKLKKGSGGP
ncbi:hypothetical protein M514_00107 [Trichuris suis]|uniref:Uncharacterized protein n=1 Tax=Trichuris suis TaxID=68888 RepID=A0A085NU27_9BILA|nr:hypothetical protein M513_00107 [Trichuris suis]KFD72973.1 hypothetical protein M514_00107 [Trichuris suis]